MGVDEKGGFLLFGERESEDEELKLECNNVGIVKWNRLRFVITNLPTVG